MPTGDERPLSRENILWEPATVVQYLRRDDAYARLRSRALTGRPTLSALVYANVLAGLRQRAINPAKLAMNLDELAEFRLAALDRAAAEAYASAYRACLASTRNLAADATPEDWFVWQVALNHLHGCRILTNDRPRYTGIVPQDDLV